MLANVEVYFEVVCILKNKVDVAVFAFLLFCYPLMAIKIMCEILFS